MPARKRRGKVRWDRLFLLLLTINVVAGLAFSPATAATKLKVVGGTKADAAIFFSAAQTLKGQPCLRVNAAAFEDRIMGSPWIRRATLGRNLFGRAELKVVYETPVGRISGSKQMVISKEGKLFGVALASPSLPLVELPASAVSAHGTIVGPWPASQVADLCQRSQKLESSGEVTVRLDGTGKVSLKLGSASILLGFPDDLDEKFGRLQEFLVSKPDFASTRSELNLVMPSRPVVRNL